MSDRDLINVLLVDDHEAVLLGLADGVKKHPRLALAGAITNTDEVLPFYINERPDVVVCDYRMPQLNGDSLTQKILAQDPTACVLMLSTYDLEEDIWRAQFAGAKGYITKSSKLSEIFQAIIHVAGGGTYFPEAIAQKLEARSERDLLSKREMEVLKLLAQGCSNREIEEKIGRTSATVRFHVSKVLSKLNAVDRTQAVLHAIERGLVRVDGA